MLYGNMSQWQSLQKMIAEERAEYRKELQRKAEFRDTLYTILCNFHRYFYCRCVRHCIFSKIFKGATGMSVFFDKWRIIPRLMMLAITIMAFYVTNWMINLPDQPLIKHLLRLSFLDALVGVSLFG